MKTFLKAIGILLLTFFAIGLGLYFFGTSDLRTETAKNNPDPAKARELLLQMAAAHGSTHWDSMSTYRVDFRDEFFGMMGQYSHPYSESKINFKLSYIPKSYDGSLEFLSGKQVGETWGIQSWKTYQRQAGKEVVFGKNADIFFWLPTYQYFIEFPIRILNADALAYAGEATIDGVACEGILASWKSTAPQRDIDQYLIWIAKDSKRIQKLEYTVREMFNFLTGAAYYKDYKNYDGLLLPSRMPVESNISGSGFLHQMQILDFIKDPVDVKVLRPDASLLVLGDDKI